MVDRPVSHNEQLAGSASADALWSLARADLVVHTEQGEDDLILWEHSTRVARSALAIAGLPEFQSPRADEVALLAAALYHDAGWIVRFRAHEVTRLEFLTRPLSATYRAAGAELMGERLSEILSPEVLVRAMEAIHELSERVPHLVESQIVSEAEALEEFGLPMLWLGMRRGLLEGKGVRAVLDHWERRQEYQYWSSRLKSAFRVDAVRDVARRRLASFEQWIHELGRQHIGEDLPGVLRVAQGVPPTIGAPHSVREIKSTERANG